MLQLQEHPAVVVVRLREVPVSDDSLVRYHFVLSAEVKRGLLYLPAHSRICTESTSTEWLKKSFCSITCSIGTFTGECT